jgi:outer membrane protein TolC
LSLGLSYNLFSGGLTRAKVDEAKARLAETTREWTDTRLQAGAQVRSAHAKLLAAQRQLALQRDNARLVEKQRALVEREYNAGQGSLVRLNEAQRDLITARGRLALARVSLRQAWFELKTETGRILEDFPPEP